MPTGKVENVKEEKVVNIFKNCLNDVDVRDLNEQARGA